MTTCVRVTPSINMFAMSAGEPLAARPLFRPEAADRLSGGSTFAGHRERRGLVESGRSLFGSCRAFRRKAPNKQSCAQRAHNEAKYEKRYPVRVALQKWLQADGCNKREACDCHSNANGTTVLRERHTSR